MDERLNPGNSKQLAGGITMANWFHSPSAKNKWKNICEFFKLHEDLKTFGGWFLCFVYSFFVKVHSDYRKFPWVQKIIFKQNLWQPCLLLVYSITGLSTWITMLVSITAMMCRGKQRRRAPCRKEKKSLKKIVLPQRKRLILICRWSCLIGWFYVNPDPTVTPVLLIKGIMLQAPGLSL